MRAAERIAAEWAAGGRDLYAALGRAVAADPGANVGDVVAALTGEAGERLRAVDQGLLRAVARTAAGAEPVAGIAALRGALAAVPVAPLFLPEIAASASMALPTRGERPDMPAFSDRAFDGWFAAKGVAYGIGLYGEKRSVYATDQFADAASPERRTIHMGIDVFAPAGTPLHAPLAGEVAFVTYNADPLDYGHTLILRHGLGGQVFHTLYGHLGGTLPGLCAVGQAVEAGQVVAHLGDWHENGGWAAHVHFQIMADMLEQRGGNFFGVGHESLWPVWAAVCPDPNLLVRLPARCFAA